MTNPVDLASMLTPGATLLATMEFLTPENQQQEQYVGEDCYLLWAIEQGGELIDGSPSPNRAVGFQLAGWGAPSADEITDEGWALYDACIDWLVASPEAPEMVAHWPMDEGAGTVVADVVGGNDGTMVGLDPAAAWLADGGVRFDNIDGHNIEVPHADVLDFADEDFSIAMMIRYPNAAAPADEDRWIIKGTHGSPGTGNRYEVFIDSTTDIRFTIDDNATKSVVEVPGTPVFSGEWVEVVAVRDAANDLMSVYADGILLGTQTDNTGDISNGESMLIGDSTDQTGQAMSGDMADIRIYSAALTEDDIASIY
jgi:hypothetical protein